MKSLEEIDELLNITFDKFENEMNFEQYIDIIQNEKSDVYLQIILFLYQKKPFNHKNIESLKLKYKEKDDEEYKQKMRYYNRKRSIGGTVKIKSPNQMSLLSPTITFLVAITLYSPLSSFFISTSTILFTNGFTYILPLYKYNISLSSFLIFSFCLLSFYLFCTFHLFFHIHHLVYLLFLYFLLV